MTKFGIVGVYPAVRRRKKKRQMKWFKNLFKSKNTIIAEQVEAFRQQEIRKKELQRYLAELANHVEAAQKKKYADPKKPVVKTQANLPKKKETK